MGDRSPSLRIGDGASRVLVHCYASCDPRDVLAELRCRGLLDDGKRSERRPAAANMPVPTTDHHARNQHRKARWLWAQRQPLSGSIAERYLRQARKISCTLPPTLGFLPQKKSEHHPAMIAAFGVPDEIEPGVLAALRNVPAVHLTLLRADGSDKADTEPQKLIVGSPGSLPIVLAPASDLLGLAISEGIEDALTAHESTGLGAWAAASASRMPALAGVIPDYIETITIFAHDDKSGRDNAHVLAERLDQRNVEIRIEGLS